jgi:hypothetical protein
VEDELAEQDFSPDGGGDGGDDTCEQELTPAAGGVTSSIGAIPYKTAEVLFWVSTDKGCLNEIDVSLRSADCELSFRADGLVDGQGRFLITEGEGQPRRESSKNCVAIPRGATR